MRPFNSEDKYLNNFKIFCILARLKLIKSFKFIIFVGFSYLDMKFFITFIMLPLSFKFRNG